MSDESVAVSVVVLTYNHGGTIREALLPILAQETTFAFEIIVHDDASSDNTQEEIKRLEREFPGRLRLMLQGENRFSKGDMVSGSVLLPIRSKYIAFCEGDDIWTDSHKLQIQWEFMESNRWCSISHHAVGLRRDVDNTVYASSISELTNYREMSIRTPGTALARGNFILTCSAMVRRDALEDRALRAMDAGFLPGDWIIFSLAANHGDIGFIKQEMSEYRLHEGNMWASLSEEERGSFDDKARWFLCTYLHGNLAEAFRDELFTAQAARPNKPTVLKELLERIAFLESECTTLFALEAELRKERDSLVALADARQLETVNLQAQLDAVTRELQRARKAQQRLKNELKSVYGSRSWRITKPLRGRR